MIKVNRKLLLVNHSGFTLIELLIVIIVIAILATGSFAAYNQYNQRRIITEEANNLHAMFQLAKSRTQSQ